MLFSLQAYIRDKKQKQVQQLKEGGAYRLVFLVAKAAAGGMDSVYGDNPAT